MRRIPNYYFRLGLSGAININKSKQNQLIYKQATIHASFTRRSTFCDLAMSMIGITQILISDIKLSAPKKKAKKKAAKRKR